MSVFFALCVTISSVLVAIMFFVLSSRNHDIFFSYFRWSWLLYTFGFGCVVLASYTQLMLPLIFKSLLDMFATVFILVAVYGILKIPVTDIWFRYSVIATLWVAITTYLGLNTLIIALPMAAMDITLSMLICLAILQKYKQDLLPNVVTVTLLLIYGAFKATFAMLPALYDDPENLFTLEFIFIIIFTVFVCLFYSTNIANTLEGTEELFQMIIENSRDAIFYYTLGETPELQYITPSIEDLTGYTTLDCRMNPKLLLQIMNEDEATILRDPLYGGDYSKLPLIETVHFVCKDGTRKAMELTCDLVIRDGQTVGLSGSFSDISKRESIRESLVQSKQSKETMLSYVSHELKTPITSVMGFATALKDGTYTSEKQREHALDVIIDKSNFLKRMIDDLSQLSKLETNQYEFAYELIKCTELAKLIKRSTMSDIENAKIRYRYNTEYAKLGDNVIVADPVRVTQVAVNLVTNAIRNTKAKNIITIKCDLDKSGENMLISVSDKGRGIKSEDLSNLFTRFYKGSQSTNADSRGLGLAICKEIVEAHGGTIDVKSTYGSGSSFFFTIPLYRD
ncbi:MAG: PAS domain S-box protein [Eubacterium sp.]|nr:PAS domain S-box protein [Candidatus Colimonas fimequi]